MKYNILCEKSKAFALRIIKLDKYLCSEKKEYVLSDQLLRSGTSIGANIREATRAQTDADFYLKLTIALKEADESAYWLELLYESGRLNKKQYESIYSDCNELIKMLVAITKTQKSKLKKDKKQLLGGKRFRT